MRPDAFVHRLIEHIGLRGQQLLASSASTAERLVNIARLGRLAAAFVRREPDAGPRDFVRYLAAVAETGLPEEDEDEAPADAPAAVAVMGMAAARPHEFDHVFVLGLSADRIPGRAPRAAEVPAALLSESGVRRDERGAREAHEDAQRHLLHLAMTRARQGLALAWAEGDGGAAAEAAGAGPAAPPPFYEDAKAAVGG